MGITMKRENLTILVAEDSDEDLYLLQRAIKRCEIPGVSVKATTCGSEAVKYLRGDGKFVDRNQFPYPTFLLTDLKMAPGDGFSILEYLRSNPQSAIIPTVVLSTSADTDDIKRAYSLGASAYLIKPTDLSTLNAMIGKLMAFWMICEVPEVDVAGVRLDTVSLGKMGDRFADDD